MERQYFDRARPRQVLCTSQAEAELLSEIYAVPADLITVVPNGYDPQAFHPGRRADERPRLRAMVGAREADVLLLLVANELHRKGLAPLLRALAQVKAPLRLVVAGAADPAPFSALTESLGLTDRVHHLGRTNDVAGVMSGADMLVLPTQYEPFGLVVVEALATGLPVLTTRLAGASVAVQPMVTGLLQDDPSDVEELAHLLDVVAEADLARWGEAAARSVGEYRKERVMARAASVILDRDVSEHPGGSA
jgi:glycosyltransferase involved in cell wall biosynthesis